MLFSEESDNKLSISIVATQAGASAGATSCCGSAFWDGVWESSLKSKLHKSIVHTVHASWASDWASATGVVWSVVEISFTWFSVCGLFSFETFVWLSGLPKRSETSSRLTELSLGVSKFSHANTALVSAVAAGWDSHSFLGTFLIIFLIIFFVQSAWTTTFLTTLFSSVGIAINWKSKISQINYTYKSKKCKKMSIFYHSGRGNFFVKRKTLQLSRVSYILLIIILLFLQSF